MPTSALPLGQATTILMKDETTFGTAATGNFTQTYIYSETLEELAPPENDPLLGIPRQNDRDQTAKGQGLSEVKGQIIVPFCFNHIGPWLKGAFGAAADTGASDPYTHTFTSGGAVLPHRSIEKKLSSNVFYLFDGCLVNKLAFDIGRRPGYDRVTVDIMGRKEAKFSNTQGGTPATAWALSQSLGVTGIFQTGAGVQVTNVTGLRAAYDNKAKTLDYIGDQRIAGHDLDDSPTFEGEIDFRFLDDTYGALARAKTALTTPTIFWSVGATRRLTMTPGVMYLEQASAKIAGPGGIKQTFKFWCEQNSSTPMLTLALKSLVAAY
jgi:hypothetical protein